MHPSEFFLSAFTGACFAAMGFGLFMWLAAPSCPQGMTPVLTSPQVWACAATVRP